METRTTKALSQNIKKCDDVIILSEAYYKECMTIEINIWLIILVL